MSRNWKGLMEERRWSWSGVRVYLVDQTLHSHHKQAQPRCLLSFAPSIDPLTSPVALSGLLGSVNHLSQSL